MKKIFILIAIFVILSLLISCSANVKIKEFLTESDALSYDNVSNFAPENSSENYEKSENSAWSFEVKDKKYTYEGYNIVILDVQNQTDINYSITIHFKYLDGNNILLQEETQSWEQFEAGYQKYFLFRPEIEFDKYTYSIDCQKYEGTCYASDVLTYCDRLREDKTTNSIVVPMFVKNNTRISMLTGLRHAVVIGKSGEIFGIYTAGKAFAIPYEAEKYLGFNEDDLNASTPTIFDLSGGKSWPDELLGATVIHINENLQLGNVSEYLTPKFNAYGGETGYMQYLQDAFGMSKKDAEKYIEIIKNSQG